MRLLIAKFPSTIFVLCVCLFATAVHAQRADSTIVIEAPDNGSIIDLTNLVAVPDDSALSDVSENASPQNIKSDSDNLSEENRQSSQTEDISEDTIIDEILAEIDEDGTVDDSINGSAMDNSAASNLSASEATEQAVSQEFAAHNQTSKPAEMNRTASSKDSEAVTTPSDASDGEDVADTTLSDSMDTNNPVQPAARVGRRALSNIGLVSIGLEDTNPRRNQLNSLLWQGSKAETIISLMADTPAYGPSPEMNKLLLSALLRQAVPPQGAGQMADEMVDARLSWLAESGRSDALAQLIRKLPNDDAWQDWQRWLVTYDLLTGNDTDACQQVALAVSETLESFWHQAQIVCQILSGNTMQAGFTADIVQASGLADAQFMALVNLFLGRVDTIALDEAVLTPLHLILMDAAHLEISQAQMSQLPVSLLQARTALRYLQRDAQLSVGLQALELGLTDLETTAELLRSQYVPEQSIIQAAARIGVEDDSLNGLVRSNLYVQLSGSFARGRDVADFDTLISEALRFEVNLGGDVLLMPLYSELITRRLNAAELPAVSDQTASDFAIWQALASPKEPLSPIVMSANPAAEAYRAILTLEQEKWSPDIIEAAAGWDWLPLIEARGAKQPEISSQMLPKDLKDVSEVVSRQVHPLYIFALERAAAEAGMGEVILLAARALAGHDLAHIRSTDLAQILTILSEAGLADSAKIIADEALRARMLDRYFSAGR